MKIFSDKALIKEDVIIDEEGNKFICMEAGRIRYCTLFDTQNKNAPKNSNNPLIEKRKV